MKVDPMVAWAAGILEGEGCFSLHYRTLPSGNTHANLAIHCEMTDEDVILKLREVLGKGNICHRTNNNRTDGCARKESWILSIQKQQEVYDTLLLIKPFMFSRRIERISTMLQVLEEDKGCKK